MPGAPAVKSNAFRTAQAAVGGDMEAWLRGRRDNGCSYGRIVQLLGALGIFVSAETVNNWCESFGGIDRGLPS